MFKLSSRLGRNWVKNNKVKQFSAGAAKKYSSRAGSDIQESFKTKKGLWLGIGCSLLAAGVFASSKNFIHLDTEIKEAKEGVPVEEVEKHANNKNGEVWVVINDKVYDLSEFLKAHPGGPQIIKKYAGKNASEIFNKYHPPDVIEKMLPPSKYLGPLHGEMEVAPDITSVDDEELRNYKIQNKPALSRIYNISDFEYVAKQVIPTNAWVYYNGGSDDEITLRENHYAYGRIYFKPKVLVDVNDVDISTEMLGVKTSGPFYCSGAAQAKLGHEEGELSIARGCGRENIIQMISSAASYPLGDIIDAALKGQKQWFQLYVTENRQASFDTIKYCEEKGIGAIFVTVDTPQLGRREKDLRIRFATDDDEEEEEEEFMSSSELGEKDPIYYKDASLTWKDIDDFKQSTKLPIVLKGVQRVEDVLIAIEHGVDAVVLSNHGGRQLDYSRAPVEVLSELMPVLKEKQLDNKIEVYIDGGIRRGTDVLKALCLGAKGVGLGRPFLYANSAYGEKGVVRAIQLLKEELICDMKLLGANKISDLTPDLLDTKSLHIKQAHRDLLYDNAYDPLTPPRFKDEPLN